MSLLDNVIKHQREELEGFQTQLEAIEQGEMRLGHNYGDGWVDITEDRAQWLRNKIAEIEEFLAEYDAGEF